MNGEALKKHIGYIDVIRVIASVFVVFMHAASEGLRTDVAGHKGWFVLAGLGSIAFCAVPLFFMVSGFLLTDSGRTGDVKVLLRERLPRLIVPLAFWSVVSIVRGMISSRVFSPVFFLKQLVGALQGPVNPSLWFMYALVAMYLISPLLCAGLRSLSRQGERLIIAIIAVVKLIYALWIVVPGFAGRFLNFEAAYYLEAFSGYLACFILGWFLGKTERRFPRPALWLIAAASFAVITAGTIVRSKAAGEYVSAFQSQSAAFEIVLAACVFLLIKQSRGAGPVRKAAHAVAPLTFAVYLMHHILLLIAGDIAPAVSLRAVLIETAAVYAASLLAAWICSRVPVLSYLACGLRFRKKNGEA